MRGSNSEALDKSSNRASQALEFHGFTTAEQIHHQTENKANYLASEPRKRTQSTQIHHHAVPTETSSKLTRSTSTA
jgi:hypothetical protein